jgi:hypothetical protein
MVVREVGSVKAAAVLRENVFVVRSSSGKLASPAALREVASVVTAQFRAAADAAARERGQARQ